VTDTGIRLSVTLTTESVSAVYVGADGLEVERVDDVAPDLGARRTINVLRQWLDRWGLLSGLSSRSRDLTATLGALGLSADFTRLPVPETFRVLGEQLFRLAFPDPVDSLFVRAKAAATGAGTTLRLVLRIKHEEDDRGWLADLPWEFLYRPDSGFFLAAESSLVLTRFLDYNEAPARIEAHRPPLKVLGVNAIPRGEEASEDAWNVSNRLGDDAAKIVTKTIRWNDLSLLTQDTMSPDVIHLFGLAHAVPGGGIELDLPDGAGPSVDALLPPGRRPPSLVVLHLLEANPFDYAAAFGAPARALIRKGVPAVLAMQYPMPTKEMVGFTNELYAHLADGVPIEEAVQQARASFFTKPGPDDRLFGAPVLYLQAPDGHLVERGARRTEHQPDPAGEVRGLGASVVPHGHGPAAGATATPPRPGVELLRVLSRAETPTREELQRLIDETPWSALTPGDADELDRRLKERLRNETGPLGPQYEQLLLRLVRGE